ncbi:MAG: hypothetical protein ACJ8DX_02345 [Xanthobacteraceae bacterium]
MAGAQLAGVTVPIHRFLKQAVFDQHAIDAMTIAFEDTLRELRLTDREDPIVEIVARVIIECARQGDRDPVQMRDCALKALKIPPAGH